MRWRLLNKIYAKLFGYFWLPCRLCGQHFGGHEWDDGNNIRFCNAAFEEGICRDCGAKIKYKVERCFIKSKK